MICSCRRARLEAAQQAGHDAGLNPLELQHLRVRDPSYGSAIRRDGQRISHKDTNGKLASPKLWLPDSACTAVGWPTGCEYRLPLEKATPRFLVALTRLPLSLYSSC